jgi:hypothetical protein
VRATEWGFGHSEAALRRAGATGVADELRSVRGVYMLVADAYRRVVGVGPAVADKAACWREWPAVAGWLWTLPGRSTRTRR